MPNELLTNKQERFIQELVKGNSQREAYKTAYPSSVKWLDKTVDEAACRLLADSKVYARYDKLRSRLIKEAEDECIVTAKQVIQELANIALANGADYAEVEEREYPELDKDGNPTGKIKVYKTVSIKSTDELDEAKRAAIAGIEQTKTGIRVKQHDKVKALELLGKHLKLFTEKQEIEHSGNLTIESYLRNYEGDEF